MRRRSVNCEHDFPFLLAQPFRQTIEKFARHGVEIHRLAPRALRLPHSAPSYTSVIGLDIFHLLETGIHVGSLRGEAIPNLVHLEIEIAQQNDDQQAYDGCCAGGGNRAERRTDTDSIIIHWWCFSHHLRCPCVVASYLRFASKTASLRSISSTLFSSSKMNLVCFSSVSRRLR